MTCVNVSDFRQHAVNVETFYKHPSKGAHVEVVEEDGNYCADKLDKDKKTGETADRNIQKCFR